MPSQREIIKEVEHLIRDEAGNMNEEALIEMAQENPLKMHEYIEGKTKMIEMELTNIQMISLTMCRAISIEIEKRKI